MFDHVYAKMIKRESLGCFKAESVSECYLVDMDDKDIQKILNQKLDSDLEDDDVFISKTAMLSSNV